MLNCPICKKFDSVFGESVVSCDCGFLRLEIWHSFTSGVIKTCRWFIKSHDGNMDLSVTFDNNGEFLGALKELSDEYTTYDHETIHLCRLSKEYEDILKISIVQETLKR